MSRSQGKFKLEVVGRIVGKTQVLTVRRVAGQKTRPLKGRRVIPSRDYSAACYDGDGHKTCIMPECQCPCHR